MRLALTLAHGVGETPPDFASRLSTRACRDHMREFCRDFGINPQAVIDGRPEAVHALAELAGVDGEALLREAFVRVGQSQTFQYKGQHLLRSSLTRNRIRVCPACMSEDIERLNCRLAARPHRRSHWLLRGIRTCAVHEIALVEIEKLDGPHILHDTSRAFSNAVPRLQSFLDQAVSQVPSKFESYLALRLSGSASGSWLDTLPLYAAMQLSFVTGAVALNGPGTTLDDLSDHDARQCEAAGFDIVDKGAEGIRAFLDQLQASFRAHRSSSGPKVMYGRLYDWLAHDCRDKAYDPVRDIVVDHALDTLPFGPGDQLFGRKISTRRLHSVHTAALAFDVHPKRLRRALRTSGIAGKSFDMLPDNKVVAESDVVAALASQLSNTMTMKAARAYLNVPRPHDEGLVQSGLIRPLIDRKRMRASMQYTFTKSDLDDFLVRLTAKAVPHFDKDPEFEPLIKAAKRSCCPVMDVVRLVLDGKLERVGLDPAERGFLSVLVSSKEVRPLVTGAAYDGLSLNQVENALSATTAAVKGLLKSGLIETTTVKNPVTGWMQPIVRHQELERFQQEYVSLFNLAKERGEHFLRVKKALIAEGVSPVADPAEIGLTLYRRSDLR